MYCAIIMNCKSKQKGQVNMNMWICKYMLARPKLLGTVTGKHRPVVVRPFLAHS